MFLYRRFHPLEVRGFSGQTNRVARYARVARQTVKLARALAFFQFFDDSVLSPAAAYHENVHFFSPLFSVGFQCLK